MANDIVKFDNDTPVITDASNVRSVLGVDAETGKVGSVALDSIATEAGKKVGSAVKVTGNVLPTLGEANKYAEVYGTAGGRQMTYNSVNVGTAVPLNSIAEFFWNGTTSTWEKLEETALPAGANGKTAEVFNPSKTGGYAVGDTVYFSTSGKKETYLVITAAAMGESPSTNPAKFEPIGGGELKTEGASGLNIKFENVTTKGYYNLAGIFNTASQTYITDFNSCATGDVIEAQTRTLADSYAIVIFDTNKNFIRGIAGSGTTTPTLTKRSTAIQAGEVYWRAASISTTEAQKHDAYASCLVGGQPNAEKVVLASKEINEDVPRTNVVTTEASVIEYLDRKNVNEINELLIPFLNPSIEPTLLDLLHIIETGGIDGSGNPNTNTTRLRTNTFLEYPSLRVVNSNLGEYVVYFYTYSGQFLGETGWITSVGDRTHSFNNASKFKMIFRNKAGSNLTPANFTALNIQVYSVVTQPEEIATKKEVINGSPKNVPFNINTKAKVVSNWEVEKMTHDGNLVVDNKGRFYMPYYASNDSFIESPTAAGVSSRMSYWNVCDINKIKYLEMMKKGDTVGIDTFSSGNAPYVPAIFINTSNQDHLLYLACVSITSDSQGWRMTGRYWNKLTETWANDTLHKCTLTYQYSGSPKTVQFSEVGISTMVQDLESRTITGVGFQMLMARWKLYNGEYYTFFGTINNATNGYIVKTTDGINYTVVTSPPTGLTNIWEGAIEIHNDKLFCVVRGSNSFFIYNLSTNIWETITNFTTNVVEQRKSLHKKDGYIYLFHNITNVSQSGWVSIRNNVRIVKIDPNTYSIVEKQEFATPHGFHYYGFVDYYDQTYLYVTQDLRHINTADPKTNISFMAWDDLVKI